uniref:BHLH domain-containing protein n=1 Tax=Oryza barthii TaxID=65489 RepID=A0A0D3H1L5_9ORYZ
MGLQGNKATHDFLSLYAAAATATDYSPLPRHPDSKPSAPAPPPAQDFFLKTHDFLPQNGGGHQWSLPIAARAVAVASSRPQQQQQQPPPPERKGGGGFMDAGSRSSGGAGFDDDDGHAARREVSSSLKELTVRVEGKGGSCSGSAGTDQMPNTPRSKHSATEQRRRSKINDRFQLLRDLLPHNDQKRDKASFLLEVIEYIRFLQEKVQKYEVSYPEWNQENAKVVPWTNIYFRSSWKNAQNKGQVPADHSPDPPELLKNGSPYMFPFTGNSDNNNAVETAAASGAQDQAETNPMSRVSYRSVDTPSPNNVADKVTSQPHAQLVRPSPAENHTVNCDKLNNSDLAIDEGTISLSSQYSQELLNKLNHALENSGIDLSQASISVQINLGKRAMKRSTPAATSTSKVGFMSRIDTKSHYIMFVVIEIGAGNGCYTWSSLIRHLIVKQWAVSLGWVMALKNIDKPQSDTNQITADGLLLKTPDIQPFFAPNCVRGAPRFYSIGSCHENDFVFLHTLTHHSIFYCSKPPELTVRVEGKGGSCSGSAGTDQMPNTPRSKHSATEQRRRSKINDRFQLLRDLLPHNDQKRDKASFLLEVIEYIRFLQEKVQKYEVSYPEWNQENAKVVPWTNIYFRSSWKNAQNKGQVPADHSPDPPELLKNGSPYMFPFTGNSDNNNAVETAAASGAQDQAETNPMSRVSYRSVDTPSPNNVADKVTSQPHAQLVRPSPAENHTVNCDKLNNSDLAIDEGTISLSSQYSQELLNKLNHALENSGIDLSQASISVQINLGKRAMKRSTPAATSTSKVGFMSRIDTKSHYIMFVVIEIGAGNGCYTWSSLIRHLIVKQWAVSLGWVMALKNIDKPQSDTNQITADGLLLKTPDIQPFFAPNCVRGAPRFYVY